MMKLIITYPSTLDERRILTNLTSTTEKKDTPKIEIGDFREMCDYIREHISVSEVLIGYITDILAATRPTQISNSPTLQYLSYGASTRAGLALIRAGQIHALIE